MPRPAASAVISIFQPWPEPLLSADDVVHRDKDIAAPVRAVLEHLHRRQMAAADLDAGQMGRDQRHGDAEVFLSARRDDRDHRP